MANDIVSRSTGSGDHGRRYPELAADLRRTIMDRFNDHNPNLSGHLGFRAVDVRRGYARLEVENREVLCNPNGVMHGGASFGLADTAVSVALGSIYGADYELLTIEMKINYLEPIYPGLVSAEAYVLRSSRRSAYAEVDIWASGKLAARASTTYMIKPVAPVVTPAP